MCFKSIDCGRLLRISTDQRYFPYMEISESTLYPILKRLEAAKMLSVYSAEHNGRLRKYYKITECGKERIKDFITEWQDVMKVYHFIAKE